MSASAASQRGRTFEASETHDVAGRRFRIRVLTAGRRGDPPLVLLHDLLTSHTSWDDVVPALARHHFVIAPDLPGFGDSEKPNPSAYPYTVEALAEDVADVTAAFRAGPAVVIGHGLGGSIAVTLASEHPELVASLVLIAPLTYPRVIKLAERAMYLPVLGPLAVKPILGAKTLRGRLAHAHAHQTPSARARVDTWLRALRGVEGRESGIASLVATADLRQVGARLSRIHKRALVVWGRDDPVVPATHGQRIVRELKGARLTVLDAGHSPHEERPDVVAALLLRFIDEKR